MNLNRIILVVLVALSSSLLLTKLFYHGNDIALFVEFVLAVFIGYATGIVIMIAYYDKQIKEAIKTLTEDIKSK